MALTKDPNTPPQPGSRAGPLIGLQIFFVIVALLVYGLRVYTRRFILNSLGSDDYIMGIAVLFSIALCINACISTAHGWAHHLSSISESNIRSLLLSIYLSELLFTISTSLAKLSILLFYLRLVVTATYRRIIYCSIGFITIWAIVFSCVVIFQCHPISAYWNPNSTPCTSPEAALFIHGLTNTFTDIYIYVLPMRMVWQVQLPKRQRIGLLVIFGAGFLVCVAGTIRLYYSILTDKSPDTPWEGFYLWTWEAVEVNLGIVCASAPCLKSLITRVVPKLFGSNGSGILPSFSTAGRGGMGGRRDGAGKRGYVLSEVGGEGMGGRKDEWRHDRDGLGCVLVAKVDDVHNMSSSVLNL